MQGKSHAIAYWLLPEPAAREVFAQTIADLARQFGAPRFEPHVTVFVGPEDSRSPTEILSELGPVSIELTIYGIQFSEQFTKTLFVQFEQSAVLQQLGDVIWKRSSSPDRYVIDPHLSLLYAELPPETKHRLADDTTFAFHRVRFNGICAMRCARPTTTSEVCAWELLAS
jgi:Cyclic phosphodiesterase-like protein